MTSSSDLNFINVVPVFEGKYIPRTVVEILRQHRDIGIRRFAVSLSFHPEGFPAREKISRLAGIFQAIRDGLAEAVRGDDDIRLGVLLQSTMGHGWSGTVPLTGESWQRIVFADGRSSSRMCPSDPEFRAYVCDAVRAVVRLEPSFLMLDDDFGLRLEECFCPAHMEMFNRAVGGHWTREALAAALKDSLGGSGGDPDLEVFCRQRRETAVNFAREIRAAIDETDPELSCVVCCPWVGHGFVPAVSDALRSASESAAWVRVNNSVYGCAHPREICVNDYKTNLIRHQLRARHLIEEADTFPQNRWSMSASLFHTHLVNGILNGLEGAKLWMNNFRQPDRSVQEPYERIFAGHLGMYRELYRIAGDIRWQGVAAPMYEARDLLNPRSDFRSLYGVREWVQEVFSSFGVPIRYAVPGGDGIYAACGADLAYLSDDEVRALCRHSLLLDSTGARELTRRGFAELIGVRTVDDPDFFFTGELNAETGVTDGLMFEAGMEKLEPVSAEVGILSWCLRRNPGGDVTRPEKAAPGMTAFVNAEGGRVVTAAWFPGMPFYKIWVPARRNLLISALDFLAGGRMEMIAAVEDHLMVKHGVCRDGSELVFALNLSTDPEPELPLRCFRRIAAVRKLSGAGAWEPVDFRQSGDIATVAAGLVIDDPVILRFEFR